MQGRGCWRCWAERGELPGRVGRRSGPRAGLRRDGPEAGRGAGVARWAAGAEAGELGRGRRRGGRFPFLFIHFLFPSFCLFLFLFLHDVQSNSLLNPCSTKSLIKQSESMLQHDATIKALKGFQFTRLTCKYKTK
jgi:hypothetical protein